MANQATTVSVYDAGLVRLTEQARAALALEADYQPTGRLEQSALDLRFGLETIGLLPESADALTVQQYTQNTYGLLGLGLDPLLAPLLPVLPSQGAEVRARVLGVGDGTALGVGDGTALGAGARLVARTGVSYNTDLSPGDTVAAVTYDGEPGSLLSLDMPQPLSQDGPQTLLLFVDGVQRGSVDFPLTAASAGFQLTLADGSAWAGVFRASPIPSRIDLDPA